jgi:hypothetical protein
MLKLYKRIDGHLHYHEAWVNDGTIYEHWGIVGERGQTKEHPLPSGLDDGDPTLDVLRSAGDAGFQPIDPEDLITLLIEFDVDGFGTPDDLEKRHGLEDRMNETLGWTALGHCDGGSIGSGTMEVCCLVVDFDVAKRVIEADLQGTTYSDFARIYREDED